MLFKRNHYRLRSSLPRLWYCTDRVLLEKTACRRHLRFYLMKGLISISVGLFCICFSHWFLEILKLLSFLYGILLLFLDFIRFSGVLIFFAKRKALVACRSKCRTVHSVFSYYHRKPIFNCYCHMDFFWCCANCRSNY